MATTGIVGVIVPWAGSYAPQNWAFCTGQLVNIADNQVLFSLIGTTYGGDGVTTFALPDLRGRVVAGSNQMGGMPAAPAISALPGATGGAVAQTLTVTNIAPHAHAMAVTASASIVAAPVAGNVTTPTAASTLAGSAVPARKFYAAAGTTPAVPLGGGMLQGNVNILPAGGIPAPVPVTTLPPSMGMNFIICTTGMYPERNN